MVLRDWAGGMTIAPEDVEKERGVIMEEWRLGRGARERVRAVQWPVLYRDSRYAERLPIGLPEIIETAPAQRLRDFYETWYQPQLMAVVAVGDFEPDSVEAMIRTRFADLPAPAAPSVRPEFDVPPHVETLVSVAGDEELSTTQVSVTFKHPREGQGRVADYRRGLVTGLFSDLLNARFAEIGELTDAPFLFAGSGAGSSVRSLDMFRVFAMTAEGGAERGLESLLTEIERVRAHGFGQGEFDRGKARYRARTRSATRPRARPMRVSMCRTSWIRSPSPASTTNTRWVWPFWTTSSWVR
jgi:zinc protease